MFKNTSKTAKILLFCKTTCNTTVDIAIVKKQRLALLDFEKKLHPLFKFVLCILSWYDLIKGKNGKPSGSMVCIGNQQPRFGIIHYYWWTASIKPRLLFPRAGYASWGLSLSSVYWSCSSVVRKDATPLTPPRAWAELYFQM